MPLQSPFDLKFANQILLCLVLALGPLQPALAVWEPLETIGNQGKLVGHQQDVYALSFRPDGKYLASGSFDGTTRIWDVKTWETVKTLAGHSHWISDVAFSPDGKYLATGALDKQIQIWDGQSWEPRQTLNIHQKGILTLTFSPDSQILASGSVDRTIKLVSTQDWQVKQVLDNHAGGVNKLAFSPDGKYLASVGFNELVVKVWDVQSGELAYTLADHTAEIYALAFSPDGRYLASAGEDKVIRLWDLHTRTKTALLAGHLGPVWVLQFTPDAQQLISGALGDRSLRFWSIPQGVNIQTLPEISPKIYALAMQPGSDILVSGHDDKLLRFWKNQAFLGSGQFSQVALQLAALQKPLFQIEVLQIDDDAQGESMGNQNGKAEPGELVEITLNLKNIGTGQAERVVATLVPKQPEILYQSPSNRFEVSMFGPAEEKKLTFALFIPKTYAQEKIEVQVDLKALRPGLHQSATVVIPLSR